MQEEIGMELYKQLLDKKTKLAVIGLGYVGMPLAIAFAKKLDVIGFETRPSGTPICFSPRIPPF